MLNNKSWWRWRTSSNEDNYQIQEKISTQSKKKVITSLKPPDQYRSRRKPSETEGHRFLTHSSKHMTKAEYKSDLTVTRWSAGWARMCTARILKYWLNLILDIKWRISTDANKENHRVLNSSSRKTGAQGPITDQEVAELSIYLSSIEAVITTTSREHQWE